jgi:CBS domain-containing protein
MHEDLTVRVADVMKTRVATVADDDSLSLAQQTMLWAGVRHLPVLEAGSLVGVLSERDILRFRAEAGDRPLAQPVRAAMTAQVETAAPGDLLAGAAERMVGQRIGCLPVVEGGDLVGIITTTDLLAQGARDSLHHRGARQLNAADVMTTDVITAAPDDGLDSALDKLAQIGARHLPVIDGERRLLGAVIGRAIRPPDDQGFATVRVGTVMETQLSTTSPDTGLAILISMFTDSRVDAVFVVDDTERLVGIVSYIDVLRAFPI